MDEATEAKLDAIHCDLLEFKGETKAQLDIMNGRQRDDHDRITRLEERTSILAGAQAIWTLIGSAIATYLGTK